MPYQNIQKSCACKEADKMLCPKANQNIKTWLKEMYLKKNIYLKREKRNDQPKNSLLRTLRGVYKTLSNI